MGGLFGGGSKSTPAATPKPPAATWDSPGNPRGDAGTAATTVAAGSLTPETGRSIAAPTRAAAPAAGADFDLEESRKRTLGAY